MKKFLAHLDPTCALALAIKAHNQSIAQLPELQAPFAMLPAKTVKAIMPEPKCPFKWQRTAKHVLQSKPTITIGTSRTWSKLHLLRLLDLPDPTFPNPETTYSHRQAAKALSLSDNSIANWIKAGILKTPITAKDLELLQHGVTATTPQPNA